MLNVTESQSKYSTNNTKQILGCDPTSKLCLCCLHNKLGVYVTQIKLVFQENKKHKNQAWRWPPFEFKFSREGASGLEMTQIQFHFSKKINKTKSGLEVTKFEIQCSEGKNESGIGGDPHANLCICVFFKQTKQNNKNNTTNHTNSGLDVTQTRTWQLKENEFRLGCDQTRIQMFKKNNEIGRRCDPTSNLVSAK